MFGGPANPKEASLREKIRRRLFSMPGIIFVTLVGMALLWSAFLFFEYIRATNIEVAQFGTGVYLTNNRKADYHGIKLVLDIMYSRQEYTFKLDTLSSSEVPKILFSQFIDDEGNSFNFSEHDPYHVTLIVKVPWEKDIMISGLAPRKQTGIYVQKRGSGLLVENLDSAIWHNLDFALNEEGSSQLFHYSVAKLVDSGKIIISFSNFKDDETNQYHYDGTKNLELSVEAELSGQGNKTFTFGIPSELQP